jgi:hypothetical protein
MHNRVSLESTDEMFNCSTYELEFEILNIKRHLDETRKQSKRNALKSTHVLLTMNLDHQQENETQNRNSTGRFRRVWFLTNESPWATTKLRASFIPNFPLDHRRCDSSPLSGLFQDFQILQASNRCSFCLLIFTIAELH